jgi:hypothetical protein
MDWEEREARAGRTWTREDGNVIVSVRQTTGTRHPSDGPGDDESGNGGWAVTLDRLEQAPEGPAYDRETVPDREAALEIAARWRAAHDAD